MPPNATGLAALDKDTTPLLLGQMVLGFVLTLSASARLAYFLDSTRASTVVTQGNDVPDETKMALPKASRDELRRPKVAWPTVALLVVAYATWAASWFGFIAGYWSAPLSVFMSFQATFWCFTVLHDAVHGAVIPNSIFNDVLGAIAGFPLFGPFYFFKQAHLCHHRFAGDHHGETQSGGGHPDGMSLDPDEWCGRGPQGLLPLRWLTVFTWYVWWYFRTTKDIRKALLELPLVVCATLCLWNGMWALAPAGRTDCIIYCHLLPTLLAQGFLAYLFDYVPHRPHVISYRDDPYRSTNVTSLFGMVDWLPLNAFSMNQNMHAVHHIWPFLPWYRYNQMWRNHGAEMTAKGTRTVPLLLTMSRSSFFEELKQEGEEKKKQQ